jgi:hypothetical protein
MCAATDLPVTSPKPKEDSTSPTSSPPSSFLTPISVKQLDTNTDASDGALFHHDTSTSSARVRQRRPSVVQSDLGLEEEGEDNYSNGSDHSVHNSFCAQMVLFPAAVCQGDQLDIFMACRHPLEMLGMGPAEGDVVVVDIDSNHHLQNDGSTNHANRVSGYHAIPTDCEYCGSPDIAHCPPDCQRPQSFFPKQRPPFCPRGGPEWDVRDFAVMTEKHGNNEMAYARADKQHS